ncbi:MAG: hypothetical protein HGA36_02495 [Candidatus Moranbacteria bacterium]|nr:hypothetical protein [Candidatus Moranbacteria bacterium]
MLKSTLTATGSLEPIEIDELLAELKKNGVGESDFNMNSTGGQFRDIELIIRTENPRELLLIFMEGSLKEAGVSDKLTFGFI